MKEKIIEELRKIENKENIKIIYAAESGSRAWGFAGIDSDYDVRFIYVRNKDFYMRLDEKKDTLEYPIDELLDISGWDISKALTLAYKSNPSLFEWIQSPIVYLKDENFNKLKDVFYNYFSIKNISNHYYHMAENQYRKYIDKKEVFNVKKYFYVLRTIFSAKYVIEKRQMPPIQFDKLRKIIAPDNINNQIDDLLKIKISAVENKSIERNNEIENYLNNLFDEVKEKINELEKEPKKDWRLLNDTFKDLVSFYNC